MAFYRCGGGADTSVVTASAEDVLSPKVIVNADGEPITGTMANQGAKTATLSAGGSYTIPKGYHNGSGKVTAKTLASQTSATATAAKIMKGYTAWVNGSKITGTKSVTIDGKEAEEDLKLELYKRIEADNGQVALPLRYYNGTMIVFNNEVHLITSQAYVGYHYKFDGSTWTRLSTSAPSATSAVIYNNEIHAFCDNSHFKFNGSEWSTVGSLPCTIDNTAGFVVYNNEIYMFYYSYNNGTEYTYKYNGKAWVKINDPRWETNMCRVAVVYNDKIHLFMNNKHIIFDGSIYTFLENTNTSVSRELVTVYNDKIHIISNDREYVYDGSKWIEDGSLVKNAHQASILVYNNELHIFGGYYAETRHNILYIPLYMKER